jgi:DUF971 family protein
MPDVVPPHPLKLSLKKDTALTIEWSNGQTSVYPIAYLRKYCPCAACKIERANPPKSRLNVLKGDFSKPLSVASAESVGNYAIRLHWSDNHASGIYSYTYLGEIAPQ